MNQPAFEHNGVLVSRQRFYEIACDPRRSVAVEACAGAGKTWMLVSRMVRALLEGCPPQDILAITFTKKAAGEMRQRLQEWLIEFSTASDDTLRAELRLRGQTQAPTADQLQTMRALHVTLLQRGRPVQIRTFHSWFASLLRSAPLAVLDSLGLPTVYELLEDDKKAVVQVWRRFQTRVAQDANARADYAAAVATYGRHQAHKALEAALNKRTEFALADAQGIVAASVARFDLQFPDFAGLETPHARLQSLSARSLIQQAASALGAQKGVKCQAAASGLERGLTDNDFSALFAALFTQKSEPRKLGDSFAGAEHVAQARDLLIGVSAAQQQHLAWLHQQRMARLTRGLLGDYAALKRERGWIDMGDLERAALSLMSDPVLSGWVQERLDARVRHVLIDEFQDTNPLQWQALSAWLSAYAGAGDAPGVFIVGDPKQSIYRFRRAEPQVFLAAKAFVVNGLGGDVLSCDHTRRNAPPVIALVNAVMQEAQTANALDGFRRHSTESDAIGQVLKLPQIGMQLDKEPEENVHSGWRDSLTTPRFEAEESRKTRECRQAAMWLAQQLQAPDATLRAKDIMVLARKRERLSLMQAELAAMGIAAQQPEKNDLAEMPEVQDLVALMDVLVSPRHDLSLAQVLKSPLFGISDDDLVLLRVQQRTLQDARTQTGSSDKPLVSWMELLVAATGLPPALAGVGAVLQRWKVWLTGLAPHDALTAIYQDGDVLARYAVAAPAAMRESVLANLNAVLNAALAVDGGRYTTAYSLVRALRAGGIAAPVRADTHAVRLLTIHGAKGLEAPLVLLLDTDGESIRSETMGVLVDWPGEAPHPLRFVFLASESRPPACVAEALATEQAARSREEINALYVALTRAKNTLVVSSMQPRVPNPASWWQRLQARTGDAPWLLPVALDPKSVTSIVEPAAGTFSLKILPIRAAAPVEYAHDAIKIIVDSLESRIGQAMHRLLEWVSPLPGGVNLSAVEALWTNEQRVQVGRSFSLDPTQTHSAVTLALGILGGDATWAWNADQIAWSANEVPVTQRGRMLRIDRLVQRRVGGAWWVLDYKSSIHPENSPEMCAQLLGYRTAIAQAYAGQTVHAAFLTPQGALIEITSP